MLIRSRSFISTGIHLISGFLGVVLMDEYLRRDIFMMKFFNGSSKIQTNLTGYPVFFIY